MLRCVVIAAVMLGLAGGWLRAEDAAATARQDMAESWGSDDGAQYAAVGFTSRTLYVALPDADNTTNDAWVDAVVTDKRLVAELRAEGFREINCGIREARL
jgi:hypothetical protein